MLLRGFANGSLEELTLPSYHPSSAADNWEFTHPEPRLSRAAANIMGSLLPVVVFFAFLLVRGTDNHRWQGFRPHNPADAYGHII